MLRKLLKKSPLIVYLVRRIVQWRNTYILNTIEKKEKFIEKKFEKKLGYKINFSKSPKTYNQKIQFRKLYDKNFLYSVCSDKYAVREYVKNKIGEEYLIPLYLVTEKLTIDQWEKLPNSFVAKTNHDSGMTQVIKDKNLVNKNMIINNLNRKLTLDYGMISLENYYSKIPRKIVVEKLIIDKKRDILQDIKIHCFRGQKDRYFFDLCSRDSITSGAISVLYDEEWNNLKVTSGTLDNKEYEKPKNLKKLLEIAKKLSEDFDYVRVDLYDIEEKIYFGELTFCENSGFEKFTDESWDYKFGSYWEQPKLK